MMETLDLNETFQQAWQGQDPFAAVLKLEGKVYRAVKARRTLSFELAQRSYFAKIHWGIGWTEILKNWLQGKAPILGARHEYEALHHLQRVGVQTMTCVAYGCRGWNPATQESFIVTEALTGTQSLEDVCRPWPQCAPAPTLKRALIHRLATMCRRMHDSGMNHRDCYLCHFHLDPEHVALADPAKLNLYIIDLHRAQIRHAVPERWRCKDLAGLYFSALDIGLTRTDCLRFVRAYEQRSLAAVFRENGARWRTVHAKARKLYGKEFKRAPRMCV